MKQIYLEDISRRMKVKTVIRISKHGITKGTCQTDCLL